MRDPFDIFKETTVADAYDASRRVPVPAGQRVINGLSYIGDGPFFGQAVTLRSMPSRADMNKAVTERAKAEHGMGNLRARAVDLCDERSVLVVDATGYNHSAIGGSTGMATLAARKAQALVTDGALRDRADFRDFHDKYGLCVAVAGWTAQSGTGSALFPHDVNVPVSVHGVLVRPGDYIFGDEDAILVIPEDFAEEVLECGVMVAKFDKYIRLISEERGVIMGKDIDFASDDFINGFLEWAKMSERQIEMYDTYQRPK